MDNPEFPPNSEASKQAATSKNIERVTSGEVIRKKKSLRKQFKEMFVAGDAKSAFGYVIFEVLLPAAKDMVVEAGHQGLEKLLYGESRRRGSTSPQAGPTGYVNYSRFSGPMPMGQNRISGPMRAMSRQARARHDFDDIILNSRVEAEEVIDRLFEVVSRISATVADLYELVGLDSAHTDQKWGWSDLYGAGVTRARGGYLLDLPDPHPIN